MERLQVESIKVQNFSVYQNLSLGKPNGNKKERLQRLCVFIGQNGVGKSTFFNIFKFLSDCLKTDTTTAIKNHGGWKRLCSYDAKNDNATKSGIKSGTKDDKAQLKQSKQLTFEIKFRNFESGKTDQPPLVTYFLAIAWDETEEQGLVQEEKLSYRRGSKGSPWNFLNTKEGIGKAISNEADYSADKTDADAKRDDFKCSKDTLGLATIGRNQNYPSIFHFYQLLSQWTKIDLKNTAMLQPVESQSTTHLSETGDNIAYIAHYMQKKHPQAYQKVIAKMQKYIPGIKGVQPKQDDFDHWRLQFEVNDFSQNFLASQISDGTIKFFGYLLLLHDPEPYSLLCVEEPENYLYYDLLENFAHELYDYAKRGGQVFVSSHSPEFLDYIDMESIYIVNKKNGHSNIEAASQKSGPLPLY